jgi:DNA-binding transcriptional MerR regulator
MAADAVNPQEGFRGPQVCKIVGITYRQLDYWARTGLLVPSISAAKGSGTQRRYSYRDVLELKVIKQLLDAGLSLVSARKAIECLREDLGEDISAANLVINGAGSVLARSGEELIDVLRGGQGVLSLVPMAGVVSELEAAITELRRPEQPATGEEPGDQAVAN